MASEPYSFIDIAVLDAVRARFAEGDALAILTIDLETALWANGGGAALLGYRDIETVMGAPSGLTPAARRQIAATPGFPRGVEQRRIAVRVAGGAAGRLANFILSSITLPDGEPAMLLAEPAPEDEAAEAVAARIIAGIGEAGYFAAILDAEGMAAARSEGFERLGIAGDTLASLVAEVAGQDDRLVKRLIPGSAGPIPAGIARLTDEPALHLLIAIDDEEEEQDEAPAPMAQDVPDARDKGFGAPKAAPDEAEETVPSDADLTERLQEDAAFVARLHGEEEEEEEEPLPVAVEAVAPLPATVPASPRSDSDDWYFSGHPEETSKPDPLGRPAAPVRFVWRTDADGAFSMISPEFAAAVGALAADVVGLPFAQVAERFGLDPEGEIGRLLDHRDTWSGRTVLWPVEGTDLVVPVDLAALPNYARDRSFEGFRGFGVARVAGAIADPAARGLALGEPATQTGDSAGEGAGEEPADEAPAAPAEAFGAEVPVISIADRRERRHSDKIIRLAEHRPAPAGGQLSAGERSAFEEIRERLRRDYESEEDKTGPEQAPAAQADEPAPAVADIADQPQREPEPEAETEIEPAPPPPAAPPVPAAPPALAAPPLQTDGFVPSAFAGDAGRAGVDAELIAGLPLPVLVHAGDELYFANREFLALTGYASLGQLRREGGLGRLFSDGERRMAAGEDDRKLRLRTLGGDEFPVEAHLQSIRWQGGSALLLALRKAKAEAAPAILPAPAPVVQAAPVIPPPDLDEMERRVAEMRTIVDTATDGVVLIAADGAIRSISRPAEALFGFDSAEVEGRPFHTLFAIESQRAARDYLNGLAENGVASVLNDGREVIGREAEGRFIPLFMTIGRLPQDGGFCAVVRDITQWKRAEEDLTQARAQAERASSQKTEFLARVSHEIRTPLNAIIGFSELMIDEKFGPIHNDRYRDYLRDINRSGNHVLDLVNDLLDISKIEAGEQEMNYEAVSLNDTLAECVAMMQPQANRDRVIIRSSLASRLPEVVADLRSVRQIALNLLSNAIRYTQAGGQVIVSTAYEAAGDVVMRVRDTGIGMTLSEIDQALKPFKQINALKRGRHDGTGLGLPLTKAMVEANRARFAISSTPGEGTMVEITFPSTRVLAD